MIKPDAKLTIKRIPLECIQVRECQERYPNRLLHYIQLLKDHPCEYAGLLFVQPSKTHPGMHELLDGHHKFCAAIMAGRPDVLCVVIEEDTAVAEAKYIPQQPLVAGGLITLEDLKPGSIFVLADGRCAVKTNYREEDSMQQYYCVFLANGQHARFPEGNQTLVREVRMV